MWTLTVPTIRLDAHASASRDQIPLRVSIPSYLSTLPDLIVPHRTNFSIPTLIPTMYYYILFSNRIAFKFKYLPMKKVTCILSLILFFYQIHTIFLEIKIFQNFFCIYFYMKKNFFFFFFSYSIYKISIKTQTIKSA